MQIPGSKDDSTFKNIEIYFIAISIGSGGSGMLITSLSITAQLIGKNVESEEIWRRVNLNFLECNCQEPRVKEKNTC